MANDFLGDLDMGSSAKEPQKLQKIGGGELEKFAKNVVDALIKDNVPPIPVNYQIYFLKQLDSGSITQTFKKRVVEMLEFDEKQDNKVSFLENKIKKSFNSLNHLLQDIAMIYKNTKVMEELIEKREGELSVSSNNLTLESTLSSLQTDLERYLAVLEKYSYTLKANFEEVSHTYKSIEENSEYDQVFGVYNQKYLMLLLQKCKDGFLKYNYQNALALFRVKEEIIKALDAKTKVVLLKNIAKILQKNAQKGNVVAHYQDGIFAVLFQHTNLQDAQHLAENIIEQIYNTSFFVSGTEVSVDIQASLALVKDDADLAKFVEKMIKELAKSGKDKEKLVILGAQ